MMNGEGTIAVIREIRRDLHNERTLYWPPGIEDIVESFSISNIQGRKKVGS